MQARNCHRLNAYLNPVRSGGDRQLLARLRADRARGVGYSETVRCALTHYYEHRDHSPTPALGTDELRALTETVTQLQAQVAQLTRAVLQLTAGQSEVQRLKDAVSAQQAQNEALRLALVASTYGDKAQRQRAAQTAADVLAGNGKGNGHD